MPPIHRFVTASMSFRVIVRAMSSRLPDGRATETTEKLNANGATSRMLSPNGVSRVARESTTMSPAVLHRLCVR
jgi:hypothetical protein